MTNSAVLDILNHLCNEARNSVHATLGVMQLLPPAAADPAWQSYLDISRSSADRLLGSIDDFRDLLSGPSPAPDPVEEFDLSLCLGEIIELLNLASQNPASHIVLEAPLEPLLVRQHRRSVEHMLTRILESAFKLTAAGDISVSACVFSSGEATGGIRFSIKPPDSSLAVRLADWLNADPEQVSFRDLADVPVSLAVMVAGKNLRVLEGITELVCEPGVPTHLATFLPSLSNANGEQHDREALPSSLNVLLTEDCDDSYALTKLMLRKENVWRARDGQEAIDMVKKQRFDIVLMDVHMGGMDGYTAIRAIREWETGSGNARTPIVVLSSDDLDTQRHSAARAGCTGYLRKPLRNNDLPDLLDRLKDARSLSM
jgi:two-component system, sensor histidine kinase